MATWIRIVPGLAVIIAAAIGLAMYATGGMTRAAAGFIETAGDGDMAAARGYLTESFKARTDANALDSFLAGNGLEGMQRGAWSIRRDENGRGILEGSIVTAGGGEVPARMELLKEHGAWKLHAISVSQPGLRSAPTAPPLPETPVVEAAAAGSSTADIVVWFGDYYQYATADIGAHPERYLPVLENALDAGATAQAVLADASIARVEALDHEIGYLALGGALDDSELTLATYRSGDGRVLLVVGSSICVDECSQRVDVFVRDAVGRLAPLANASVFPEVGASEFIVPGVVMPTQFVGVTPSIDFRPLPNGRDLELSAWFGDEAENEVAMQSPQLAGRVTRKLVLRWNPAQGRFTRA
ncbi:MAG: hypothetical protein L0H23_08350 [Luteimonas sp.]|nr:hypothetical protein [Luteimonas sp.]